MTPRRILLVGNFDRKALGRHFFNTDHKLLNGFIRLGHFALPFSDRDVAREVWPWRSSRLGRAGMNRRLLETARHFRPHLVLFFHSDLVTAETFEALRRVAPDAGRPSRRVLHHHRLPGGAARDLAAPRCCGLHAEPG
jgi:hypothetical protein